MPQSRGGARGVASTRRKFMHALISAESRGPSKVEGRAAYIVRHEFDSSVLEDILGNLDAALLTPSGAGAGHRTSIVGSEISASAALCDLTNFYESFSSRKGGLLAIKQECFRLLLDKWDHVTAWMVILLQSRSLDPAKQLLDALAILGVIQAVIHATEVDLYREEILPLECTIEVMIAAICKIDRVTSAFYFTAEGGSCPECQIVRAFVIFIQANDGCRDMVVSRIKGTKGRTIVKALIGRAQQTLNEYSMARYPHRSAATLACLSKVVGELSCGCADEFLHHKVYQKYARVLSSLIQRSVDDGVSDSLVWNEYARCIMGSLTYSLYGAANKGANTHGIVRQFLEGGALRGTLDCLSRIVSLKAPARDEGLIGGICGGIRAVIQYLPVRQVYTIAIAEHRNEIFKILNESLEPAVDAHVSSSCQDLKKALARGDTDVAYQSMGANGGVSTCSNLSHRPRKYATSEDTGMGTCGGCHALCYCSEECQNEDWNVYHSKECRRIPAYEIKPSWRTRCNQLSYVEAVANSYLHPLPEQQRMRITQDHDPSIRAEGLTGCQQPYQRNSALAWLNISGSLRDTITQFEPRLSVNYHYADCWVYSMRALGTWKAAPIALP